MASLALAACGGSSDSAADTTSAPESSATTTTSAAEPPPTEVPTSEATATDAAPGTESDAGAEAAGASIAVSLVEWAVGAPPSATAGTVTFDVSNDGQFTHELLVIAGEATKRCPSKRAERWTWASSHRAQLLGETGRLSSGSSAALTVDLAAGHYVLLCNITGGGSSHARGQVLEFDVS
ncbi:MAG: hypothetical protein R2715_18925 [Ilumatobacteraceae bacterium]